MSAREKSYASSLAGTAIHSQHDWNLGMGHLLAPRVSDQFKKALHLHEGSLGKCYRQYSFFCYINDSWWIGLKPLVAIIDEGCKCLLLYSSQIRPDRQLGYLLGIVSTLDV